MDESYFTRLAGKVEGPFTLDELADRAARNKFSSIHEVSFDRASWSAADALLSRIRQSKTRRKRRRKKAPAPPKSQEVVQEVAPADESSLPLRDLDRATTRRRKWHYTTNGQRVEHPVSERKLLKLIQSGEVGTDDLVWCDDLADWEPVGDQEEFSDLFGTSSLTGGDSTSRDVSRYAVLATVFGLVGYVLLLVCTVMIVLRMRAAPIVFADNIGVLSMALADLLLGVAAVVLGHVGITGFYRLSGSNRERNHIVVGLSSGYTIIIVVVLLTVAASISASGTVA
ncbi:MAG: DUF4339 domain-containing protein [Planctomycetaceae bacterium]